MILGFNGATSDTRDRENQSSDPSENWALCLVYLHVTPFEIVFFLLLHSGNRIRDSLKISNILIAINGVLVRTISTASHSHHIAGRRRGGHKCCGRTKRATSDEMTAPMEKKTESAVTRDCFPLGMCSRTRRRGPGHRDLGRMRWGATGGRHARLTCSPAYRAEHHRSKHGRGDDADVVVRYCVCDMA